MKKIYYIIFSLLLFSCNKNDNFTKKKDSSFVEEVNDLFTKVKQQKHTEKEKVKYLNEILDIIEKSENSLKNRKLNYELISKYYSLKSWENYKIATNILLKNSLASNDIINLGNSYRSLGNYFFESKQLDSSFYYYTKSEKFYKTANDFDGYSTILLKKGTIQFVINDFTGADLTLTKALFTTKKNKYESKKHVILNLLGLNSNQLQEYNKAINYFNQALIEFRKNHFENDLQYHESIYLSNIGLVHQNLKNHRKAIEYFEKSLKINNLKEDLPSGYSNIIDNMAYSKLQIGDFEKLPQYFFESLEMRKKINDDSAIVTSYIHLSEYYNKMNDKDKALKYANKALNLSKMIKNSVDILSSLKQASIIDDKNASKHYNDYFRINDSIDIEERKSKDRFARIQFETDEITKEKDIAVQHKQNVITGASILLILGILFFIIYRQRTAKKKLLLEQSNQKINEEIYQLMLSQKNNEEAITQKEKKRIALELHDGVMNKLASTRLNLFVLSKKNDPETIKKCISHIAEIQSIEQEIRNIAHDLNNEIFKTENSFIQMLKDLIQNKESNSLTQYEIEIDKTIPWEKISSEIKMNLYRILQEAIHNIEKHANAKKATISFIKDQNNIGMSVSDNGTGFDTQKKKNGIGIQNMLYRVKNLNGKISINSFPNSNTSINISIPFD